MVFNITTLNSLQKNPLIQLKGTVVNCGNVEKVVYTVPAGKKAQATMFSDQNVALGANTFQNMKISGSLLRKMVALDGGMVSENINGYNMNAGDTISYVGDNAANNGTINFLITVQELPA